ncbi:alkaline-responsive transcriptional regulator [Maudiozyma humilis]|uniref:Alkaline-responsive transcriptional regulator n=1 Tax=Maudiozyma humilis TaxID=51915 RepID=A0AAV5S3R4_MAUHU|nr:alkaline-responsive transcriptional regulator [Kazachstania humilis]
MDKFNNPAKPQLADNQIKSHQVSLHNLLNETEKDSNGSVAAPAPAQVPAPTSATAVSTPAAASPQSTTADNQSPLYVAPSVRHGHDSGASSPSAYHYKPVIGNTVISPVSEQSPSAPSSECNHTLPSPTSSQPERTSTTTSSTSSGVSTPPEHAHEHDTEELRCKWGDCTQVFHQPELLYHHLCQDHVGRKSQRNLQLNCQWDGCTTKTEKRDHITSHIRVHIPLKPFVCSSCSKKFKRPQDLKKHLKIHLDSGSIVKRKRGPKAGSKRLGKGMQQGMMVDQRSRSLPLNAITGLPHMPEGLRTFVTNDIHHYQPVFTHRLDSKLQSVMGQTSNGMMADPRATTAQGNGSIPSPSSVMDTLPPQVMAHAAGFFSDLSNNMVSSAMPMYQNRSMPMQHTLQPILEKYPQLPPLKSSAMPKPGMVYQNPVQMVDASATNGKPTMLPSLADGSMLQPRYNNTAPTVMQGQPQAFVAGRPQMPGQTPDMWQRGAPQMYPVLSNVPMQQQQQVGTMGAAHAGVPYGIPSGLVYNPMQSAGSTLNMVENRFSTTQRGAEKSGEQEVEDVEDAEEEAEFEQTLEFVNVIRDYLMCTLLEDEYEDVDADEDGTDSGNLTKTFVGDLNNKTTDLISKYPKIMV